MTKLHWNELTDEEKARFGNGCGLGVRLFRVKDIFFDADCRHHDFNYARGGTSLDRFKADRDFLYAMLSDISKLDIREQRKYLRRAIFYYFMVRSFGWLFFVYGKYRDKEEVLN